jgi:Fe-S-cluster containining protein
MNPPSAPDPLPEVARSLSESAAKSGRFGRTAAKIQALFDNRLPQVLSGPVDCKVGCDFCCHRLVGATFPEVIAVAEHVSTNFSAEEGQALMERIAQYEADEVEHFNRRVVSFRSACPFLVEHKCSIYDVRPISCRSIFSPDAKKCEKWMQREAEAPFYTDPIRLGASIDKGVISGTYEGGAPSGLFELPGAVGCLLKMGPAATDRSNVTAPVERHVLTSPLNDKKMHSSKTFIHWLEKPRFTDLWDAAGGGNMETVNILTPKFKDDTLSILAALNLPALYGSQDELEEAWAHLETAMARFEETRFDPAHAYELLGIGHSFYWPYTGKDVRSLLERFKTKLFRDIVSPAYPALVSPLPERRKPGRFRLGYVSRLENFNGSRWATGWLENQSPDIETFAFNTWSDEDEISNFWRRKADHYFNLPIASAHVAGFIRSLDLDALIFTDIGMGRLDHQLTSFRLARRQFTAWGHPVTSGSPMVDGYLSSVLMEPENGDDHYTEKLFRLPGSGLCYPRVTTAEHVVQPEAYGLPRSGYYFNCQMPSKNLPKDDHLYRQISEASGKPIAFLEPLQEFKREKLEMRLKAAGFNAVVLPRRPLPEFLSLIRQADAILDTPAWNGGNSTIDALAMGRPVISMVSEFMRGRHALAFLNIAGVGDLIAKDEQDYVSLALDKDRQEAAMVNLNVEALYEDKAPVRALDEILLNGIA